MPRAELRLRLLSRVGEARRVPTDKSWTSNPVTTLRTAQRHAALHLQAYVRRFLQKRFTRGTGATSSSYQHILQHLVQKGQAVIADIETTAAQRAAGHLFTWQARRQAYGEGVIALSNRPHKTLAQQQVWHRMLTQARFLQATLRHNLARNRRRPPPPEKNAACGWAHVIPLSATPQHIQRRKQMAEWSDLAVGTHQDLTCIFGAHHLPSNRSAMLRTAQEMTEAAAKQSKPHPLIQATDSTVKQQGQIGVGQQVRISGLQVQCVLNGGLGHIVREGNLADRYAVGIQKTGLVSL